MSTFSDLHAKAQQLVIELEKFSQGELQAAKDIAKEIEQNLKHEIDKEVGAPTPPAAPTTGVQTSSDLSG